MMQSSMHFPPLRQGRSVRHTEAAETSAPSAHSPPRQGSHAAVRRRDRRGLSWHPSSPAIRARPEAGDGHPALWGARGARFGGCVPAAGQGSLLSGSPPGGVTILFLLQEPGRGQKPGITQPALAYGLGQRGRRTCVKQTHRR